MINSEPISTMNRMMPSRSQNNYNQYQPPTSQRLTLEQQYNQLSHNMMQSSQQDQQSNPYSDYLDSFNSCNSLIQGKIQNDDRYVTIFNQCQSALLHEAFTQVMPSVLSTQQGRVLFERLNSITQILKDEYTQKEIQREKQIEDREKATEQERRELESQKLELATMMAQIRELQQSTITPQQAYTQPPQQPMTQSTTPSQNAPQGIIEPVTATQNNPYNQQNQNNYPNNHSKKNNNKPHSKEAFLNE